MAKRYAVRFMAAVLCCWLYFGTARVAQAQELLFKSDFEPNSSVIGTYSRIGGVDQSTGYDWDNIPGVNHNTFQYTASDTQKVDIGIITTTGPFGNEVKALSTKTITSHNGLYRAEFQFRPDGAGLDQGYVRYWARLPVGYETMFSENDFPWWMFMEWKDGGPCATFRISVYLGEGAGNSGPLGWRAWGQQRCNAQGQQQAITYWNENSGITPPPGGQWFKVEAYRNTKPGQERFWFAIDNQVIFDRTNTVKHPTNHQPLFFWSIFKQYKSGDWPGGLATLWTDLEVWTGIPEGATGAVIRVEPEKGGIAGIRVYPNPVNARLTIELPGNKKNWQYRVTDLQGRTLMDGRLNSRQDTLETGSLQPGIYLLRLMNGNGANAVYRVMKH